MTVLDFALPAGIALTPALVTFVASLAHAWNARPRYKRGRSHPIRRIVRRRTLQPA